MKYENKLFDIEENKSENENRILPTDNFHFSTNKKNKNKNKYTLSNRIESKKSGKDLIKAKNNTKNLFSNVILKELLTKNLNNNELKSSVIQKNNYLENNNKTKQEKKNSHILSIKRNSLKFIKENKKISSRDKDFDNKINIYNSLQKKIINNNNRKSKRIRDNKFNSHSISINNENKNINVTIFPEKVNIKEESYLYRNKINKIINKNINEINDAFQKLNYPSSKHNSLNVLYIKKNTNINQKRYMNNAFLTPKNSYSKKNIFHNENIKQMNEDNNRIILNELNNLKKLNLKGKQNKKKLNNFNMNHQSKFHKTFNLVNIENYKNRLFSNHNKRPPLFLENGDIHQKKNNKSLSLNENKVEKCKYKRIKSSYIRHNKPEFGYINSLSQKKLLDSKYNDIPNNRIKESIFSNILSNVEENESFNNNIVCQLYKRPQINILTLLELKSK